MDEPGRPDADTQVEAPSTDPRAVAALVLSLVALVMIFPVVPAVAALVVTRRSRLGIAQSQGALTGTGLLTAATVLAWLHLTLMVLLAVAVVALLTGLVSVTRG